MRKFVPVLILLALASTAWAERNSVTHTDVQVQKVVVVAASQVGHTNPFLIGRDRTSNELVARQGLGKSLNQSALIQGTGTSPNFKVEALCSMDGATFTKPEVGGDLGTFTDQNPHFVAISVPLSPGGIELQFTELGGSNTITVNSTLASQ